MKKNNRYLKGIASEAVARVYLCMKGYKIIAKRLITPAGEIDILAQKKDSLIVVEVKYRKDELSLLHSITGYQKKRLYMAGSWAMGKYKVSNVRFDAILISGIKIKHIENAWGQD